MAAGYGDRLRARDYAVRSIPIQVARALVEAHHYAGGASNTAVATHGLFRVDDPARPLGVAWWLPPTRLAAESVWPNWRAVVALSRLVVAPEVPKNGATFLLMASVRLLQATDPRWECLVTWADTWQGHTGGIYRAANWEALGLTKPSPVWVNGAGRMMSKKRGKNNLSPAAMEAAGFTKVATAQRHKFRLVLPVRRPSARPTEAAVQCVLPGCETDPLTA